MIRFSSFYFGFSFKSPSFEAFQTNRLFVFFNQPVPLDAALVDWRSHVLIVYISNDLEALLCMHAI